MSSSDYAALNLNQSDNPTESDIRQAYKKLALLLHPDKNLEDPTGAKFSFQVLQDAYESIMRRFMSGDGSAAKPGQTYAYSAEREKEMREHHTYMESMFAQFREEQDRFREDYKKMQEDLRQKQEETQRIMMVMAAMHKQQAKEAARKLKSELKAQGIAIEGAQTVHGRRANGRVKVGGQHTKGEKKRLRLQAVAASQQHWDGLGVDGRYQGEVYCEREVIVEAFTMVMDYSD